MRFRGKAASVLGPLGPTDPLEVLASAFACVPFKSEGAAGRVASADLFLSTHGREFQ